MERNAATHLPPSTTVPPRPAPDVDVALLRAVRAFLVDDDAVGAALDAAVHDGALGVVASVVPESSFSSSDSSDGTAPAAAACTRSARPPSVNISRKRMQSEIRALQQKAIALEQRLAEIQGGDSTTPASTATASVHDETPGVWQKIAQTQRERITVAERERDKLRALVADSKAAIKRVRRVLKKQIARHAEQPQQLLPPDLELEITRQGVRHLDVPAHFADLATYLETMYLQLDTVFQDARLDSVTEQVQDVRIQNDDTLDMTFEFIESRLLPFDVATTASAVWYYHKSKYAEVGMRLIDDSVDPDDVLRRSFVSTVSFPNYKGRAHGRCEARRYVEKDRVIILHCSIFHRLEKSESDTVIEGFGVRVLSWTVIGPLRDPQFCTTGAPRVSHVDAFKVVMPFFPDGDTTRYNTPQDRDELKTFCLKSTEFVHAFEKQAIENILVSGVLGERSGP